MGKLIHIVELGLMLHEHHAELYRKSESYRKSWHSNPPYQIVASGTGVGGDLELQEKNDCKTCCHFGDELTIGEKKKLSLKLSRTWHECKAGNDPICICDTFRECKDHKETA